MAGLHSGKDGRGLTCDARNQEVPVHGVEHATESCGSERQDTRHPKDVGDGPIPEDTDGMSPRHDCLPAALGTQGADGAHQDETDPIETTFELNDTLFAKAEVPPTDEVYIWLGANVMLAYPMDEAETLLVERLSKAKKSLVDCEEDAEFLREQITVSRLVMALMSALPRGNCVCSHLARPWRSRRPGYTTGTSCRSARRRARRTAKKRTATSLVVAEPAVQGGERLGLQHREVFISTRHDCPPEGPRRTTDAPLSRVQAASTVGRPVG